MSTDYTDTFRIGRVVTRTFSVVGRNAMIFVAVAAVLLLPNILMSFVNGTPNVATGTRLNGFALGLATVAVNIICTYLLQAALVQATITDLNGEKADLGNALSTAFSLAPPVIAISILTLLGVGLGMILLVVPGLMLMCAWCVAVPARVVEGTGIGDAFGRSRELTKGHRWPIFGLLVIYGIVAILTGIGIMLVSGVALSQANQVQGNIPYIVLTWLEQVVLAVITAVGVTAVYYELRTVKEGISPRQLAAAFD